MQFCAAEVGGDLEQAADDEGQNQEQGAACCVGNVSQGGETTGANSGADAQAITAPRPGFLPRSLVLDIDNVSPFAFCAAAVHTGTLFVFGDCLPIFLPLPAGDWTKPEKKYVFSPGFVSQQQLYLPTPLL